MVTWGEGVQHLRHVWHAVRSGIWTGWGGTAEGSVDWGRSGNGRATRWPATESHLTCTHTVVPVDLEGTVSIGDRVTQCARGTVPTYNRMPRAHHDNVTRGTIARGARQTGAPEARSLPQRPREPGRRCERGATSRGFTLLFSLPRQKNVLQAMDAGAAAPQSQGTQPLAARPPKRHPHKPATARAPAVTLPHATRQTRQRSEPNRPLARTCPDAHRSRRAILLQPTPGPGPSEQRRRRLGDKLSVRQPPDNHTRRPSGYHGVPAIIRSQDDKSADQVLSPLLQGCDFFPTL